jgi:hypothetical protein
LKNELSKVINENLAKENGHFQVFNEKGLEINYETPFDPQMIKDELRFGINGYFYRNGSE